MLHGTGGEKKKAEKLSDRKSRTVWRERGIKYTGLQGENFPVAHNKSSWQPVQCFVAYYSRFAAGILWGPPLTSHKNVSCNLLAGVYSEVSRPCPFPPGRITVFKTTITGLWHNRSGRKPSYITRTDRRRDGKAALGGPAHLRCAVRAAKCCKLKSIATNQCVQPGRGREPSGFNGLQRREVQRDRITGTLPQCIMRLHSTEVKAIEDSWKVEGCLI